MKPFVPDGYLEVPAAIDRVAQATCGDGFVRLTQADTIGLGLYRDSLRRVSKAPPPPGRLNPYRPAPAVGVQVKPPPPSAPPKEIKALLEKTALRWSQQDAASGWLRQRLYGGAVPFMVLTKGGSLREVGGANIGSDERWGHVVEGHSANFTYQADNLFGYSTVKGRIIIRRVDIENALRANDTKPKQSQLRNPHNALLRCQEWLVSLMTNESRQEKNRDEYLAEAQSKYGISERRFGTAWAGALAQVGNENWGKPGRKHKAQSAAE